MEANEPSVGFIDLGKDWAKYLGPRFRHLGKHSGEAFREDVLLPALKVHGTVVIGLDSVEGYTASFFEEAFGGLVRAVGYSQAAPRVKFDAIRRRYLIPLIEGFMRDEQPAHP